MEEIKGDKSTRGLYDEFNKIDQAIPEGKDEINKKEEDSESVKQYIALIMGELDELKSKVHSEENNNKKEKQSKKRWKVISGLELILIILITAAFILTNKNNQAKETFLDTGEPQIQITGIDKEPSRKGTVKIVDHLDEAIKVAKVDELPFEVSVQELYGYEYLCFTNKRLQVYYRNEFDAGDDNKRDCIIIDNGKRKAEYNWDYDLNGDLADLCPYIGDYKKDGNRQLLFIIYNQQSDRKTEKELRFVDAGTLWEYDVFDVHDEIMNLFSFSYEESSVAVNIEGQEPLSTYMNLMIYDKSYRYLISKDAYVNAVYYNEELLNVSDHITFDITEEDVNLLSVFTLSEDEYLGQFAASIGVDGREYSIQNVKYGAYVQANQEDIDLEGVIIPRSEPMVDYVTIHGNKGESFIIEKSTVLNPFSYKLENIIADENGIKTYYVDEKPVSKLGIDVSKYQGEIDWGKVKASGVDYAFVRIGYRGMNRGEGNGNLGYDEYYKANIKGALDAGIDTGVYFFSQAITIEEAIEEANYVIDALQEYDITYPVVFDTEAVYVNGYSARANDLTRQERTDITKVFCETIQAAGYQPMIYANTKWMIMGIDLEQLDEYPRWFAYYGNNFVFPYDVQIWQYSDSGKIDGIKGNVDLNISFVDFD